MRRPTVGCATRSDRAPLRTSSDGGQRRERTGDRPNRASCAEDNRPCKNAFLICRCRCRRERGAWSRSRHVQTTSVSRVARGAALELAPSRGARAAEPAPPRVPADPRGRLRSVHHLRSAFGRRDGGVDRAWAVPASCANPGGYGNSSTAGCMTSAGTYRDFHAVTEDALAYAARAHGINLSAEARRTLVAFVRAARAVAGFAGGARIDEEGRPSPGTARELHARDDREPPRERGAPAAVRRAHLDRPREDVQAGSARIRPGPSVLKLRVRRSRSRPSAAGTPPAPSGLGIRRFG